MKARGKREARRPWFIQYMSFRPEGPKYTRYYAPSSGLDGILIVYQGRRAFALAPGFHIPRLCRCFLALAFIFRAFAAV